MGGPVYPVYKEAMLHSTDPGQAVPGFERAARKTSPRPERRSDLNQSQ